MHWNWKHGLKGLGNGVRVVSKHRGSKGHKNKGQSKVRRQMAKKSRRINRRK